MRIHEKRNPREHAGPKQALLVRDLYLRGEHAGFRVECRAQLRDLPLEDRIRLGRHGELGTNPRRHVFNQIFREIDDHLDGVHLHNPDQGSCGDREISRIGLKSSSARGAYPQQAISTSCIFESFFPAQTFAA